MTVDRGPFELGDTGNLIQWNNPGPNDRGALGTIHLHSRWETLLPMRAGLSGTHRNGQGRYVLGVVPWPARTVGGLELSACGKETSPACVKARSWYSTGFQYELI